MVLIVVVVVVVVGDDFWHLGGFVEQVVAVAVHLEVHGYVA